MNSKNTPTKRINSNYSSRKNQSLLDELQIINHYHNPASAMITPERKPTNHQQLLSTIIANSRDSNNDECVLPHSSSPKLSPSRFLFSIMAIIHDNISHSFSSVTEDDDLWFVSPSFDDWEDDHNSLIRDFGGLIGGCTDAECTPEEEGLEVILNCDRSLTYVSS